MNRAGSVVWGTVLVVVAVGVLSGPLVGAVDLTTEPPDPEALGTGAATVDVESVPTDARLDETAYSGAYALEIPAATVAVSNVTGEPMLVYRLRIPELGAQRSTVFFLDGETEGELALSIESESVDAERITQDEYDAELRLLLRADGDDEVLHESDVTVEVSG